MSAQQDTMTAAVAAGEVAVQQLAEACSDYLAAYRVGAQSVSMSTGLPTVAVLEQAVGHARLTQNVSARLITLAFR